MTFDGKQWVIDDHAIAATNAAVDHSETDAHIGRRPDAHSIGPRVVAIQSPQGDMYVLSDTVGDRARPGHWVLDSQATWHRGMRTPPPDASTIAPFEPALKHYDPGNEGRYAYNPRNTYKRVNSEI